VIASGGLAWERRSGQVIDPASTQLLEPLKEWAGIEAELRHDQRRHATALNVRAFCFEH